MKTAYTPGPWRLAQYSTGAEIYGTMRGLNQMLASVVSCRHDDPEGNSNARLIAAAPELFEALQLVLIFHDSGPWTSEKAQAWANGLTRLMGPAIERRDIPSNEATTKNLCNAVRAAIAKVTQGTP